MLDGSECLAFHFENAAIWSNSGATSGCNKVPYRAPCRATRGCNKVPYRAPYRAIRGAIRYLVAPPCCTNTKGPISIIGNCKQGKDKGQQAISCNQVICSATRRKAIHKVQTHVP